MKTITAIDLRKKLGSLLDEVSQKGEQIIISRANKPLAVMISMEEYQEKVLKKNREKRLKKLLSQMDRWKRNHAKETGDIDIVQAIREIRDGR